MAKTEVRRAEEALEHLGITNGEDPTGESGEQIPVRTPIAGVVLERLVTQGTAVTTGTPLFVVSDLSPLWAIAEVDEAHLSALAVGRPAELAVPAYPASAFAGTIDFIADTVNPTTRRVTVRAVVPNPDGRLKPQMYATVSLGAGEPRRAVVVPADGGAGPRRRARRVRRRRRRPVHAAPGRHGRGARRDVEIAKGCGPARAIADEGQLPAQVPDDAPAGRRTDVGVVERFVAPRCASGCSSCSARRARRHRRRRVPAAAGRGVPRPHEQPGRGRHRGARPGRARGGAARHLPDRDRADGRARRRAGPLDLQVRALDRHRRLRRRRADVLRAAAGQRAAGRGARPHARRGSTPRSARSRPRSARSTST